MTNILITSAGRRVELVQVWKESALSLLGTEAKVYATDINPFLSAACKLADQSFQVCRCTDPNYSAQILQLCLTHGIKLIIPTIDPELQVFADAREVFLEADVHLVVSDSELVRQCRDKRNTAELFTSLSIPTPKILDPLDLVFPCFMKPVRGSCSKGIKTIPSVDYLAPADTLDPSNLFQELVPDHWVEYTVDLYYSKFGVLLCCVARERLEVRSGEISKGITRKDNVLKALKERVGTINGARGVLALQIFVDQSREKILGIEINPRFGGGYPMSHAAGANYPCMLIKEYLLGESMSYHDEWRSDLVLLRYDNMISCDSSMIAGIP